MIDKTLSCLNLSVEQLKQISEKFCQDMEQALAGQPTSLKMLSSYLPPATGIEHGLFLVVDFGGTNVRVLEVYLAGNHWLRVERKRVFPLKTRSIDYTAKDCTGEMLFDYIASEIANFVGGSTANYLLGHTFSFPFVQLQANQAVLLDWTKEFQTSDVVGQDVTSLLTAALSRQGVTGITPIVVMNDTVATFLTASYQQAQVTIGSICGTGHNSCYVETNRDSTVIMNLESGNFAGIPLTPWDKMLDERSANPGRQLLEKQVSGGYLGKLVSLIFTELIRTRTGEAAAVLDQEISLTGEDLANILLAPSPTILASEAIIPGAKLTMADCELLKIVTAAVTERSARLVAATFSGILAHVDPQLHNQHCIAIDGSLYEKMPGYAEQIRQALVELQGMKAAAVRLTLVKDGSGIGAAVGAALYQRRS
jgi:hexokinase